MNVHIKGYFKLRLPVTVLKHSYVISSLWPLPFVSTIKVSEKERGIDRIKRSVLKNSYEAGGLNITDIDCLNRSLKLRQYIRANGVNHP